MSFSIGAYIYNAIKKGDVLKKQLTFKKTLLVFLFIITSSVQTIIHAKILWVNHPDTTQNNCDLSLDSYCTIQSAVDAASNRDTIKISSGRFSEKITINKHLTLLGNGYEETIIDAGNTGSVITISPGSKVTIKTLAAVNGRAINGGGVFNNGSLMLINVHIKNNVAQQSGGGIFNAKTASGSLFISKCEIVKNKSLGDDQYNMKYGGGGIYNNSPLVINKTTISDNYATDNGGGIYSIYSGRKAPSSSELIAEEIGLSAPAKRKGTLFRKTDIGSVSIQKSHITNNISGSGGGISLQGVMNINRSSITNNSATSHNRGSGGGIFAHLDTTLHINNTTISKNKANFRGGGIRFYTSRVGSLNNVTIIENMIMEKFGQGAGLYLENFSKKLNVQNTVIANNTIMSEIDSDCYGKITSLGFNLIGINHRCNWLENTGDIIDQTKKIDPELYWSTKEERYFITDSSPLIDAGSPNGCRNEKSEILKVDQLGNLRALTRCDIGAVEFTKNHSDN